MTFFVWLLLILMPVLMQAAAPKQHSIDEYVVSYFPDQQLRSSACYHSTDYSPDIRADARSTLPILTLRWLMLRLVLGMAAGGAQGDYREHPEV